MLVTHKKTKENILEKPTAEREREKEKHLMIDYHIYIKIWAGLGCRQKD